jgi:predicted phosphodiesterase
LGDGDELWENLFFKDIFEANKNVYLLMKKFHETNKLDLIFGNHDMVYRNALIAKRNLSDYFDSVTGKKLPLLPNITFQEGIVLVHSETQQEIFLTHGHQAEFMNSVGWKINRFLVRVLWKPLQVWGIKDPTSPAKNYKESIKVERRIRKWIADHSNKMTIVGHTHRPHFPKPKELNFFNSGSCVHPRSITGIEIYEGTIALIKWQIATNDEGVLQIVKEFMEGPIPIEAYRST